MAYLSPEQVVSGRADGRSDVYAAGVVLYEMLTGQPPYTADNPLSVAYRHVNEDVPPPSALVPGLPPAVDALVARATSRDPEQRPVDAEHFRRELLDMADRLGLPRTATPRPPGPPPPTTAPPSPPDRCATAARRRRTGPRRHPGADPDPRRARHRRHPRRSAGADDPRGAGRAPSWPPGVRAVDGAAPAAGRAGRDGRLVARVGPLDHDARGHRPGPGAGDRAGRRVRPDPHRHRTRRRRRGPDRVAQVDPAPETRCCAAPRSPWWCPPAGPRSPTCPPAVPWPPRRTPCAAPG
ncbi:protein kinase [Pseudonocardia sp. ICBG601]|uniref:serine/threonine protein kinase n=1 Tax=Pseudonocardia sp. ICBG601 TaxID=2846759 RepID=UPI0021F635DF|nr:protein kinase [Pseudonocardia sp. ICBG601]